MAINPVQKLRRARTSEAMAAALDLLSRRWALRVVWELRVGPLNFRALQEACGGISPSVLQRRLHELRDVEVVQKIPGHGYRLGQHGASQHRYGAVSTCRG